MCKCVIDFFFYIDHTLKHYYSGYTGLNTDMMKSSSTVYSYLFNMATRKLKIASVVEIIFPLDSVRLEHEVILGREKLVSASRPLNT